MTNLLITISMLTLIFVFIIKLIIFYSLAKLFNREAKPFPILKAFLIYEALALLFILVYPELGGFSSTGGIILHMLPFVILSCLLFLIAIYLTKLFSWKKALAVFILMFFIITPLISYLVSKVALEIFGGPEEELSWDLLLNPPLSIRIMDKIDNSLGGGTLGQYYISIIFSLSSASAD